jgi:hypothetical protein
LPKTFWDKQDCTPDQSFFTLQRGQKGYRDQLTIILDSSHWLYGGSVAHIGVHAKSDQTYQYFRPLTFDLKISEFTIDQVMDEP